MVEPSFHGVKYTVSKSNFNILFWGLKMYNVISLPQSLYIYSLALAIVSLLSIHSNQACWSKQSNTCRWHIPGTFPTSSKSLLTVSQTYTLKRLLEMQSLFIPLETHLAIFSKSCDMNCKAWYQMISIVNMWVGVYSLGGGNIQHDGLMSFNLFKWHYQGCLNNDWFFLLYIFYSSFLTKYIKVSMQCNNMIQYT